MEARILGQYEQNDDYEHRSDNHPDFPVQSFQMNHLAFGNKKKIPLKTPALERQEPFHSGGTLACVVQAFTLRTVVARPESNRRPDPGASTWVFQSIMSNHAPDRRLVST